MDKVIIDRVDVSKCKYYKGYCRISALCDYSGHICEVDHDCYYKQLQRAKAENERLKEETKEIKKYQYEQEYLDKEIEEMQKALKTLAEGLNIRQQTLQEIKKYSTEMRELANDDVAYHYFKTVLSIITKAENKMSNYCKECYKKQEEIEQLKQTLQEIREMAEKDFRHTAWEEYARQSKEIITKINEVIGKK